jgi:hypothetical protein
MPPVRMRVEGGTGWCARGKGPLPPDPPHQLNQNGRSDAARATVSMAIAATAAP